MKPITINLLLLISFFFAKNIFSQGLITDDDYKFKITLPSDWSVSNIEEANKKNAIFYEIYKNDSANSILLLATRVSNVKDIKDWVYVLEKDAKLKISERFGGYTDFDHGTYDGTWAIYKDSKAVETIYYYRTKYSDSEDNYTYMLRFVTLSSFHNSDVEKEIKAIEKTFTPTF